MQKKFSVAIVGAGSWGTAMAIHLAKMEHRVLLWGRNGEDMHKMAERRENHLYLPNIAFPPTLNVTAVLADIADAEIIILAVPSHAFRELLTQLFSYFSPLSKLVWITKGLDPLSHQLLHEVVQDYPEKFPNFAVLSGPTFAREIALGLPAAVTVASNQEEVANTLVQIFHTPQFRVYFSKDIIGVELGGAVKNVLAIAVGIAEGLQYGANAQAALITRGMAEMLRLAKALGAMPETLIGLSGLGDLVLTCTNNQSRNRRFGVALGQGKSITLAQQEIGQVVEGIKTAAEVYFLAQQHQVEMPIVTQVYQLLYQQLSPLQAVNNLLSRQPKAE